MHWKEVFKCSIIRILYVNEGYILINIDKISYSYKKNEDIESNKAEKKALDNINLDIKKGEFIAILGANGSGKSTLAKHLNALVLPDEGCVYIDGKNTKDEEKLIDIRKEVGMVFQNPDNQIIASLVEEDVAFGPENIGVETSKIREAVDNSLKKVGMDGYQKRNPNYLSGGQKQRVAIAGALAISPKCIVFDEPTSMLDPKGREDVIFLINELNKKYGVTIILITHYMEEVINADRLLVMDSGKVVMSGSVLEIFERAGELEKLGLDIPLTLKLSNLLKEKGIKSVSGIVDKDELISKLCLLK